MDPTVRVKILHHTRGTDEKRRFQTGDPLREAIVFEQAMPHDGVKDILRRISTALRIAPRYGCGPPKHQWVIEYRRRHHYRLEVGDVVVVGEQAWALSELPPRPDGYSLRNRHAEWQRVSLFGSEILRPQAQRRLTGDD